MIAFDEGLGGTDGFGLVHAGVCACDCEFIEGVGVEGIAEVDYAIDLG